MLTEKKDSNAKYLQSIIDGIPEPILGIGRDYSIRFMNQASKAVSLLAPRQRPETDFRATGFIMIAKPPAIPQTNLVR